MKIVCFGDSNTYGFDPRLGSSGRYAKDERWTGILDAHDGFSVVNEGMNGRCIPDSDSGFASLASVLVIPGITAERAADRMRRVFQNVPELREFTRKAGKHTLIVSPARPSEHVVFYEMAGIESGQTKESTAKIMDELPNALKRCAEEYGADFADAGEWDIALAYDGIHFSEAGHRSFAEHMAAVLGRLL